MTHIANWVRSIFDATDGVYISRETPSHSRMRPLSGYPIRLEMSSTESNDTKPGHVNPPTRSSERGGSLAGPLPHLAGYKLWPSRQSKSAQVEVCIPILQNRSPSSLSDTSPSSKGGLWLRGTSLARRRKISVPELRGTATLDNITKAQGLDSPTIPGRPPLHSESGDQRTGHERSSSFPGDEWRNGPFGEAMASCITGPKLEAPATSPHHPAWPIMSNSEWTAFNPTRPLSPIFSPLESTTPTTAVPLDCPMDFPPRVPPKPCQATSGGSPLMKSSPTKSPSKQSSISSSPKQSLSSLQFNPDQAATRPQTPPSHSPRTSPSRVATTVSPTRKSPKPVPSALPLTSESLNSDRGRQIVRQRSKKVAAVGEKEETAYYASLPKGLTPMEAAIMLPEVEKETLRKHASSQAERYEVLGARHVANLSQELRALDERCEYLRKTYKSLRVGRQRLHGRMISYLRSETLIFSKDRLLRQEEALVELDKSIDDWTVKLERAENRRLRVRQKLLEHVAAAMTLNLASAQPGHGLQSTPPGSPPRMESPDPLRVDRKDVESIKIYADNQVLMLFTDIEQAIGRMCEAC